MRNNRTTSHCWKPERYTERLCGGDNLYIWLDCRAGNLLIRSSLICSDRSRQMSGRSEEMSDRQQITQVSQDKWATKKDLLRSLRGNERMSNSLKKCWLKKSKILFFSMFHIHFFFLKKWANRSFPLFWWACEWIAQVAHKKWAMWANRSGCSPKLSNHEWFAHITQRKWAIVSKSLRSFTKNERMSELLNRRGLSHF